MFRIQCRQKGSHTSLVPFLSLAFLFPLPQGFEIYKFEFDPERLVPSIYRGIRRVRGYQLDHPEAMHSLELLLSPV